MTDMNFVGVDPGVTGAVAMMDSEGVVLQVTDVTKMESGLAGINNEIYVPQLLHITNAVCLVEDLSVTLWNSQSAPAIEFSKAYNMGLLMSDLRHQCSEVYTTSPTTWKKAMGVSKDKETSLRLARTLPAAAEYLTRQKDHDRAEAILLAEYMRQMYSDPKLMKVLLARPAKAAATRLKNRRSQALKKSRARGASLVDPLPDHEKLM